MNVVQAGPTPVVAVAAQAATSRPAQEKEAQLPAKAVKATPKGEQTAKYAQHSAHPKTRGSRVDIEA